MLLTRRITSQSPQKRGFPNLNPIKCKEIKNFGVKWEVRQEWDPQRLATVARSNRAGDWAIHLTGSLQRQRHLRTVVAVLTTHQAQKMKGLFGTSTYGCRNVALFGSLATPRQTCSPEEFRPTISVYASVRPSKHQRCHYYNNKMPVLDRTEGLEVLRVDSSVSTVTAAQSVMPNTCWAELKHCFILSYHRNYKCNVKLQENILTIFPSCVDFHL